MSQTTVAISWPRFWSTTISSSLIWTSSSHGLMPPPMYHQEISCPFFFTRDLQGRLWFHYSSVMFFHLSRWGQMSHIPHQGENLIISKFCLSHLLQHQYLLDPRKLCVSVDMITNWNPFLQLKMMQSLFQMQVILDALHQLFARKGLPYLLCRSLIHHIIF